MPTKSYETRVENILEVVSEDESIPAENTELIHDYRRDKELNGLSAATQQRNLSYIKLLAEYVGDTHFRELDESDMKDFIEHLHDRDLADETIDTYKKALRSFWKWLTDSDEPEAVAWMSLSNSNDNDTLPKDLLTKTDIEKQIEAAKNPRDKALIALLYETGARIGELIDLTVGDIEDRKHGKKVIIDGKTGPRRMPLVESVPYINQWLSQHPNPEKDAPLWCKIQQGSPDDQLGYRYILKKILKKNMERAGIDKPANPHHYRHSRASELANDLTEAQLCEWFGWAQGSDVPARYVHLSGRDIDNAYDEMHGLYEPEEDEQEPNVIECPRCGELNEPGATFCMKCAFGLDQDKAEEIETVVESDMKQSYAETDPDNEETLVDLEILDDLLDDPQKRAQFFDLGKEERKQFLEVFGE